MEPHEHGPPEGTHRTRPPKTLAPHPQHPESIHAILAAFADGHAEAILSLAGRVVRESACNFRDALHRCSPDEITDRAVVSFHRVYTRKPEAYAGVRSDADLRRVLYVYCRHAAMELIRSERRAMRCRPLDQDVPAPFRTPETEIEELFKRLEREVSPRDWKVIELLRKGESHQEIAKRLGVTANAIFQIIARARKTMALAESGERKQKTPRAGGSRRAGRAPREFAVEAAAGS